MTRSSTLRFAGWLAATALLVYFLRQVDAAQVKAVTAAMDWRWIAVSLIANAAILASWAAMWWAIAPQAERVKYSTMLEINSIASALMNTVPFLGGHAAAVGLLIRRGRMSQAGALSVMALDQLGEGIAKLTIFGFVAALAPIPAWMRVGVATVCGAVAALFIALLIAAHGHARLLRATSMTSNSIQMRVRRFVAAWGSRLETLRSGSRSMLALVFCLGTKLAEGVGLFTVQHALGVDLGAGATALVLAAVTLGSMIPVAPGNVGTYEAGAFMAYRHLGIEPGLATILAVAAHISFMIPSVGIGYLVATWRTVASGPATHRAAATDR